MIVIRCSNLENIRRNPTAYGQLLASGEIGNPGGTYGMFSCFQEVARQVHLGECDATEAIKELYKKFLRFNDTTRNNERQKYLIDEFAKYCNVFDKNEFVMIEGVKLIKWNFSGEARLTGRTPWVVARDGEYFCYFLIEKDARWQSELRFPLYQKYLAEKVLNCKGSKVNVGVYSLSKRDFEFKCYSTKEADFAIEELKSIFKIIQREIKKKTLSY